MAMSLSFLGLCAAADAELGGMIADARDLSCCGVPWTSPHPDLISSDALCSHSTCLATVRDAT
jgi:ABC-type dipeptide/oligopeptide/nickel transport system permease subunit